MVYDDLDLASATVRLRAKGGHGGHNGMRSITQHFSGSKDFPRLRIGALGPTVLSAACSGQRHAQTCKQSERQSREEGLPCDSHALATFQTSVCLSASSIYKVLPCMCFSLQNLLGTVRFHSAAGVQIIPCLTILL